jgi:hypothetical protein
MVDETSQRLPLLDHLTMVHVVHSSGCVPFSALMSSYFVVLNRIVIQYIFTIGIIIYY